jgi:hypothetical protein
MPEISGAKMNCKFRPFGASSPVSLKEFEGTDRVRRI